MAHLKPHEFAELVDGELAPARAAHLDECPACRMEADDVRDALRRASALDVPEPSPLFWEHFASRVQHAIGSEAPVGEEQTGWLRRPAAAWALSASIALILLAAMFGRAMLPGRNTAGPSSDTASSQAGAGSSEPASALVVPSLEGDIEDDGAWALVRVVAEDVAWEDAQAAGIGAAAGVAEDLVVDLTQGERAELARLIETELRERGA